MERITGPRNITGAAVRGDDLFGHEAFLESLERGVAVGNLLLLAPRRWGKSSVLQTFSEANPNRRRYIDLYHVNTPEEFVVEVAKRCEGLSERVGHALGKIYEHTLGRIKSIKAGELGMDLHKPPAEGADWKSQGDELMSALGHERV
ncbi:MAG: ATPase domain protein, prokaryote domain protein, partial [Chloroflexi bacterium]|nr:ATPase domain protein, prokaryote domain protein [Chloroflexota bacterium]